MGPYWFLEIAGDEQPLRAYRMAVEEAFRPVYGRVQLGGRNRSDPIDEASSVWLRKDLDRHEFVVDLPPEPGQQARPVVSGVTAEELLRNLSAYLTRRFGASSSG